MYSIIRGSDVNTLELKINGIMKKYKVEFIGSLCVNNTFNGSVVTGTEFYRELLILDYKGIDL